MTTTYPAGRPTGPALALSILTGGLLIGLMTTGCRDFPYYDGQPSSAPDAGPDTDPVTQIICEDEIPAATSGGCDVTAGSDQALVLRGDVLGADAVYANGSVLIVDEQIVCVGCDCADQPDYAEATRIDCADAVISPGIINPHDHITFTERAPLPDDGTRYNHRHEWREALSTPGNQHGTGATSTGTRWGEVRMVISGVTSMVGSGSATGMVRNLDRLSDGDEALGFEEVEFETFPLGD
ncbi:MAG: hypothetical protein AAGC55_13290, partial [Myxococcota bacterium]